MPGFRSRHSPRLGLWCFNPTTEDLLGKRCSAFSPLATCISFSRAPALVPISSSLLRSMRALVIYMVVRWVEKGLCDIPKVTASRGVQTGQKHGTETKAVDRMQLLVLRLTVARVLSVCCRYGAEFRRADRNDWGGSDYNDVMTGALWLIKQGFADKDHVSHIGWSYGGYMSALAMGTSKTTHGLSLRSIVTGGTLTDLISHTGTSELLAVWSS